MGGEKGYDMQQSAVMVLTNGDYFVDVRGGIERGLEVGEVEFGLL